MGLNLPRSMKAVIAIVVDTDLSMHQRIEAGAVLLESNVPPEVVRATSKFLLEVAESQTCTPGQRLAAAKAVLKRDVGRFKRLRIEPPKYVDSWLRTTKTAAEMVENGLRLTAERDARLERERQRQLKLVSSVEDPATDKAG
jgi:hypothetical protein